MLETSLLKLKLFEIEINYLLIECVKEAYISLVHLIKYYSDIQQKNLEMLNDKLERIIQLIEDMEEMVFKQNVCHHFVGTSFADKFTPRGYPVETFKFISEMLVEAELRQRLWLNFQYNEPINEQQIEKIHAMIQNIFMKILQIMPLFDEKVKPRKRYFYKKKDLNYYINFIHNASMLLRGRIQ
ncbi:hypothetical protein [Bacillus luti]|uniref:hypothetical protein n=1 Tax=Bacillus luti TaxID=2026191 RepID=UPI003772C5E2